MRKIYTKTVFVFDSKTGQFNVDENESQHHFISDDAPVMEMRGGGGSDRSTVTNVTKTDPWSAQQPYLQEGFKQILEAFGKGEMPAYYPGSTVAQFDPASIEAQNSMMARARSGSPLNAANNQFIQKTLSGDYLTGGAGMNAAMEAAKNKIFPMVDSTFEKAGRGGSGLADVAKSQGLSDAFANQFEAERQNQLYASKFAPDAANQDYNDIAKLGQVGNQRELMNQANITADQQRYDYNQNARRNSILQYMNAIQGNYGGTVSSMSPDQQLTGWARYLAGAGQGATAGFAGSGGNPYAAGAGGLLGLIGSL